VKEVGRQATRVTRDRQRSHDARSDNRTIAVDSRTLRRDGAERVEPETRRKGP